MYPTFHSPQYSQFRDLLDYAHHRNLARLLTNRWREGALLVGKVQEARIGPPLEAVILTYFWQGELWLLAGYWARFGEPTPELMELVQTYVEAIQCGKPLT